MIDDDEDRAGALAELLARDAGTTIVRHARGGAIAESLKAHSPDLVLIDMARADRDALDCVRQVSEADPRPIALFVDEDDPAFMAQAISAGVSSYIAGRPPADLKPILRAAVALFHHHQGARVRAQVAEAGLRDRQTVDRAKHLLMRSRRLGEPEAHRWLQRQAMSRGRRLVEIAAEVLASGGERDLG